MNEKEKISTIYRDIEITYDERRDKWLFTLRGKDRSAETLTNAKNKIDAPPPKTDTPFKRFEAWHRGYGGIEKVTVTSITEDGHFWITVNTQGGKERSQVGIYELYARDSQNDAVVEKLKAKGAEINKLRKELEAIQKELRHVEPKDWE